MANNILELWGVCDSTLTVAQKRALGFLETMSRNEYAQAIELEQESNTILAVLKIYLIDYEESLFVLEDLKFG